MLLACGCAPIGIREKVYDGEVGREVLYEVAFGQKQPDNVAVINASISKYIVAWWAPWHYLVTNLNPRWYAEIISTDAWIKYAQAQLFVAQKVTWQDAEQDLASCPEWFTPNDGYDVLTSHLTSIRYVYMFIDRMRVNGRLHVFIHRT